MVNITLIDGPLGSQLSQRGVATDSPLWSAAAIDQAPDTIAAIHRDYVAAGASVHTTNTFRTQCRAVGDQWQRLTRKAVQLARENAGGHRVAGSIAPLRDCYRPDLSPKNPRPEHHAMATLLADAGCDLLLCETFPHLGEAVVATEEAARTGVETWVALTAGPEADLLSPEQVAEGAKRAVDAGAAAVLVNCVPAAETLRFVLALENAKLRVPIGAYANAGSLDDQIGWDAPPDTGAQTYLQLVRRWVDAGATIVGGCCGTGPPHIEAIARFYSAPSAQGWSLGLR
jgi:S-methylmethionine-dependent homocysteine/selenocysteine methylase